MIRALRGAVFDCSDGQVVIDVGGVGYQVFIPDSALSQLPSVGEETSLYIHTHVREDAIQLYGFPTQRELWMFETLISVSGIGPRLGLAVLSHLTPDQIAQAVLAGEARPFTRVPGVGKKTAARMLLELKDKLKGFALSQEKPAVEAGAGPQRATADTQPLGDAVAALVALGFPEAEAAEAVAAAAAETDSGGHDVQDLIKGALKRLDRVG